MHPAFRRPVQRLFVLLCSVSCLLLTACAEEPVEEEPLTQILYYEPLARGLQTTLADTIATEVVIRDSVTWAQYRDSLQAPVPLPEADFSQSMVVLVGRRFASGGYDLDIDAIDVTDDGLLVTYVVNEPDDNCVTTMGLTYPYTAVVTPPTPGPVRFATVTRTFSCAMD